MLKKLIDTNIFIDRFANPILYKDIFLSEGFVYLSAAVLMELRGGAHTPNAIKAVNDLADLFKKVDRIILPSIKDYEQAGEIISKLQVKKGYEIEKCASITNDALIAALSFCNSENYDSCPLFLARTLRAVPASQRLLGDRRD